MTIQTIKKWLAAIMTGLLSGVLFAIVFIVLGINDISNESFTIETAIVTIMLIILRFFWYENGEDRAEELLAPTKHAYADLVEENISDQENLQIFLDYLNEKNRKAWIANKLGKKTEKNYAKFEKLKSRLERKVARKVPLVTITQIMTRSSRLEIISGKDFRTIRKIFQQVSAFVVSIAWATLLSLIAFKQINMSIENIFRYITYLFSMTWAIVTSLINGYNITKKETIDHIARLTMIVNRYAVWKKNHEETQKCSVELQVTQDMTTQEAL